MAGPIADDWKAINQRMQQIKAEEAGLPCDVCKDVGWTPDLFRARQNYGFSAPSAHKVCQACGNPRQLPKPVRY